MHPLTPELLGVGLSAAAAQKLLAQHPEAALRAALEGLAHLVQGGFQPKSRAAVLRDLLAHPAKYQFPALVAAPVSKQGVKSPSKPAAKPTLKLDSAESVPLLPAESSEPDEGCEERDFRALPLEEQAHALCARLRVVLGKSFDERWRAKLRAGVQDGDVDAWALMTGAIRAAFARRPGEVIAQLEAL